MRRRLLCQGGYTQILRKVEIVLSIRRHEEQLRLTPMIPLGKILNRARHLCGQYAIQREQGGNGVQIAVDDRELSTEAPAEAAVAKPEGNQKSLNKLIRNAIVKSQQKMPDLSSTTRLIIASSQGAEGTR